MGYHRGANIIRDGLQLYLDAGNPKSYKGEPTTNVVTNTNLDDGWSKGYAKDILWNDYPAPLGVNSQVVSFVDADNNGSSYWYCYGNYAPQEPSTTYTISIYVRTIGEGVTFRGYTADNSEVGRQNTNTVTFPGDGKWHRIIFNPITTPANTESDSLSFYFTYLAPGQRVWLCAPQMEAKDHATNFTVGTRTETTIYDLSGNNNHGTLIDNPTQEGNFIYLDGTGTNDGVTAGPSIAISEPLTSTVNNPNGVTYELIYKPHDSIRRALLWGAGTMRHVELNNNTYRTEAGYTNGYSFSNSAAVSVPNKWNHLAIVFGPEGATRPVYWYLNGELFYTHPDLYASAGTTNEYFSFSTIGRSTGSPTYSYAPSFLGNIGIFRLYNKALSDGEVMTNYLATKNRFKDE